MNTRYHEVLEYFPEKLRPMLEKTFEIMGDNLNEIRVRCNMPLVAISSNGSFSICPDGNVSSTFDGAYVVSNLDLRKIFQAICENSVYAYMDDIKQGFITIKGGHRVGFSGKVVTSGKKIENFREISSLNIRIAREVIGAADHIMESLATPERVLNTLLVSPPMGGKTTVLRDVARQFSNRKIKTALIDDRGELAAMFKGVPQNDVGVQTDVIENAPKSDAITMMLRSMSPQLIVTDEISTREDAEALMRSFGTGVSVVASAHGNSAKEVMQRKNLSGLFGGIGFERIIVLSKEGSGINTRVLGDVTVIEK